jgi:hypothetical protein
MGRATAGRRQTASRPHAAFRPAARSLTVSVAADAPFAAPDLKFWPRVTPRMFSRSIRHHGVGQFLNYLTLLLGIEHVLDEMNFYQWHCRSPRWYSRTSVGWLFPSAKTLIKL